MCRYNRRNFRTGCGFLPRVRYSAIVRRNSAAVLALTSLLWCASGAGVLMVAAHEHLHHAETHDHGRAIETAIHGHAHDSTPDHEHEFTAPLGASRTSTATQLPNLCSEYNAASDHARGESHRRLAPAALSREHGPPPYLMHCVLLT
jgi:hypothetical protein